MSLKQLPGLGPKTEGLLKSVGIQTKEGFMAWDPVALYAHIVRQKGKTSINLLYAFIGAQEGVSWLVIAQERRSELLIMLDDLGIAP